MSSLRRALASRCWRVWRSLPGAPRFSIPFIIAFRASTMSCLDQGMSSRWTPGCGCSTIAGQVKQSTPGRQQKNAGDWKLQWELRFDVGSSWLWSTTVTDWFLSNWFWNNGNAETSGLAGANHGQRISTLTKWFQLSSIASLLRMVNFQLITNPAQVRRVG